MNIQPIDLPSFLRALLWPSLAIVAVVLYRKSLSNLIGVLGRRVHKVSLAGVSVELAQASEITPVEAEIQQLAAGPYPQSGSDSLFNLMSILRYEQHEYLVVDLGSVTSPKWLTSRLYLLSTLITLLDRQLCFVFLETIGDVRRRFIGAADADRVRRSCARKYAWFEAAGAFAYASIGVPQYDPQTGLMLDNQLAQLMQTFLGQIQWSGAAPVSYPMSSSPVTDAQNWVTLKDGVSEHAKWVDGARIERLLGADLNRSGVVLPPGKLVSDMKRVVLGQNGRFVAILEQDLTFRELVDRYSSLEGLAQEYVKQHES